MTSGELAGSDSGTTLWLMRGDGFEVIGTAWSTLDDDPHWTCGYCQPGDSLSLSMRYDQLQVSYNGNPYGEGEGRLTFLSETVTLPDVAPGGSGILARPFSFSGRLVGVGPAGTLDLTGGGEVRIRFIHRLASDQEPAHLDVTRLTYVFQDTDPVPEPATMLLLGTGLAGVAAARRRRKSTTTSDQRLATSDQRLATSD